MRRGDQLQKNTGGRWLETLGTYREAKKSNPKKVATELAITFPTESKSEWTNTRCRNEQYVYHLSGQG